MKRNRGYSDVGDMARKFPWKMLFLIIVMIVGIGVIGLTADSNDAGYRTVIQYPNGSLRVKFSPGWYLKWFGNTTVYNDVITYDFDRNANSDGATLDSPGIPVRYRDGGTGTVYGIVQYRLPGEGDLDKMIDLHKTYRTNKGVANKLIKQVTEEAMNLTAGLMASEEGYDTLRAVFTEWASDQIKLGKFKTTTSTIIVADQVTGKTISKKIPVIDYAEDEITPLHFPSDLQTYGISVIGQVRLNDPDFEEKTKNQISEKRKATMAIITAKANAEKAKQDTITAEEQGKAQVMVARYEKEVIKEQALVEAERAKEVAVIKASQHVEVAAQGLLEAEQKALAALEYKKEMIAKGEGESEYNRMIIESDGALKLKIDAWKETTIAGYKYLGQQKWTPELTMGGGGGNTDSVDNITSFMDILKTNAAKQLLLDMEMQAGGQPVSAVSTNGSDVAVN